MSALIQQYDLGLNRTVYPETGNNGPAKLARASRLQDAGDKIRQSKGGHAIASLAIQEIRRRRGVKEAGSDRLCFILDLIKHPEEVTLLRKVYDSTFRLVAVHCAHDRRKIRLLSDDNMIAKFFGADEKGVSEYMRRDEKDPRDKLGQQVRGAFFLADFFLDNNIKQEQGATLIADIQRFTDLVLGRKSPF